MTVGMAVIVNSPMTIFLVGEYASAFVAVACFVDSEIMEVRRYVVAGINWSAARNRKNHNTVLEFNYLFLEMRGPAEMISCRGG